MRKSSLKLNIFRRGLSVGLVFGLVGTVLAQGTSIPGLEPGGSRLDELLAPREELRPTLQPFFEGPVDPETFQLGPGDLLDIFLWRPTVTRFPVYVNAEGEVVIPTVGPVKVTGMSLAEAKKAIIGKVRERFSGVELTVSLNQVRQFRVHVCGAVATPGSYLVPATARVADAIFVAGGLLRRARARWDTTSVTVGSKRRIGLIGDQSPAAERPVDLALFEQAGEVKANPYLRDGDVVWVPFKEEGPSEIGVFGGVFSPGLFEYMPGDRVADLMKLAGGVRASAKVSEAYLVHADGQRLFVHDAALLETEVQPGDRLYVPMEPERQRFGTVTLKGEVAEPGSYPVEIGRTTLREVLGQAGGVLPSAALSSARLIRAPNYEFRDPEKERLLRPRDQGNILERDYVERALTAAYERWLGTTVVLDLSRLLEDDNPDDDVVLQDGDVLEVPQQPLGIRMLGYVNQSGETPYHLGWKLDDYLQAVGGVNRAGRKAHTRVVKASTGSIVFYSSEVRLDPGDIIYVPPRGLVTTWSQIKDGIVVASQVATIVLIVLTAGR